MKVAFDTNVLVSAVATRGLCADLLRLVLLQHELIVGETVLGEVARVLQTKMRVPATVVARFLGLLRAEARIAPTVTLLRIALRDADDLPVLSEAVAAGAQVLVTGDEDLLLINVPLPLEILSPRGLWERLRKPPEE